MIKASIDYHISRKRALSLIASFSLVLFLLYALIISSSQPSIIQLNSLLHSEYLFSALLDETNISNSYYLYNAGIDFAVSEDSKTRVNADVIMQLEDNIYDGTIFWNAGGLSEDEIAITKGVARSNGLAIGDSVFSKRIVDGKVCKYTVKQILPDTRTIKTTKGQPVTEGIVIMGYDPVYIENVSHSTLLFSNHQINDLMSTTSSVPTDLLYRSDEITRAGLTILPYFVVLTIVSLIIISVLNLTLKKSIYYNFIRMKTLGFDQKKMYNSYHNLVVKISMSAIFLSLLFSFLFYIIIGINTVGVIILISLAVMEIITTTIETTFIKRKLWRQ